MTVNTEQGDFLANEGKQEPEIDNIGIT